MTTNHNNELHLELTTEIVAAYVSQNPVSTDKLPELIRNTSAALNKLTDAVVPVEPEQPTPAVSVKKSQQDDYLICLGCGKQFSSLKRHIKSSHGLTPDAYREQWNLRKDYPMVAPAYAERRSKLAKELGLGRKSK